MNDIHYYSGLLHLIKEDYDWLIRGIKDLKEGWLVAMNNVEIRFNPHGLNENERKYARRLESAIDEELILLYIKNGFKLCPQEIKSIYERARVRAESSL